MEEYYNFLMFELKDIEEEFDIPSQIAHEICLLFSSGNSSIPESFFRLYLSKLDTDYSILYNATAYFSGAKFLKIECDCQQSDKILCDLYSVSESAFYEIGAKDFVNTTSKWQKISQSIQMIRTSIFNDC
jgi:hypothetical protein